MIRYVVLVDRAVVALADIGRQRLAQRFDTADVGIGGAFAGLDRVAEVVAQRLRRQMRRHRLAHVDQRSESGLSTQDQASAIGAAAQSSTLGLNFMLVDRLFCGDLSEFACQSGRRNMRAAAGYAIMPAGF